MDDRIGKQIEIAKKVMGRILELGYVKLAKDQNLPDGGFYETTPLYNEAVRIMLRAGWRKVEGE